MLETDAFLDSQEKLEATAKVKKAAASWLPWVKTGGRVLGSDILWSWKMELQSKQLHPGRLTWNIIIEVWKIIFLSTWVIYMFHVNLPGCILVTWENWAPKDWQVQYQVPWWCPGFLHFFFGLFQVIMANPVFEWMFSSTTISHVKIWFIISLKQPFITP